MSKELPPSRTADQYVVRFPDGMRDRIAAVAAANNRSMNAEIVARLQASFDAPAVKPEHDVMYVLLDSSGHPISWHEIYEYAAAIRKAGKFNVVEARYQILTPDMESSSRRVQEVADLAKRLRAEGRSQVVKASRDAEQKAAVDAMKGRGKPTPREK